MARNRRARGTRLDLSWPCTQMGASLRKKALSSSGFGMIPNTAFSRPNARNAATASASSTSSSLLNSSFMRSMNAWSIAGVGDGKSLGELKCSAFAWGKINGAL